MQGYLWVVGTAVVIFAGVISYAVARRYGWGAALLLSALALVTSIAMQWQAQGLGLEDGMRLAGASLVFSAPVTLGVLAGIVIAWLRRG